MLKVTTLIENTSVSREYQSKHGLSLYIETPNHKILFDLGPNGLFAKIYIRRQAFDSHYIKVLGFPFCVGLDAKLLADNRMVFTDDVTVIDDELMIFSDVKTESYASRSNQVLFVKENAGLVQDNFSHEQNLLITVNGEVALFSGCSHAGIVNICKKAESLAKGEIKHVIGGFHLYNPPTGKYESDELIDGIANELAKSNCNYYTCHCTGQKAYDRMKKGLGDRLDYLSAGSKCIL